MDPLPGKPTSLWLETTPETAYPTLAEDLTVDVAVVGAGIAGLTAAFALKEEGKTVAVLESKRIVHGATGYTTAKLTSGHGMIYSHLSKSFGDDGARIYAESQEAAISHVRRLVGDRGIGCDLEDKDNYVYTTDMEHADEMHEEVAAAVRAGLRAELVRDTPLPYDVVAAIRLTGQAQFNPRKYLLHLASEIDGDGSHVFEQSSVTGVEDGEPCVVATAGGHKVRARDVVVATHLPVLDRGLFFAKAHPKRSYVIAGPVADKDAPDGMFITNDEPMRSLRTAKGEEGRMLLVGGEHHRPGAAADTEKFYERLAVFALEELGLSTISLRWSTQDYFSVDRVPFTGPLTRGSHHVFVTTGYGGWGMTNGTLGALILRDRILGRENPWASLYDSKRLNLDTAAPRLISENAVVGVHFMGDRIRTRPSVESLTPGTGAVIRNGLKHLAVYRNDSGELSCLSATCTHLGCIVEWNQAERSWDCPCHGSRFDLGGKVIQGPAVRDLGQEEL